MKNCKDTRSRKSSLSSLIALTPVPDFFSSAILTNSIIFHSN